MRLMVHSPPLDRRDGPGEINLVPHQDLRHFCRAPISARTWFTASICASRSSLAESTTCNNESACAVSSRVAWKAAAERQRSRMKPTVSESTARSAPCASDVQPAGGGVEGGEELVGRVGAALVSALNSVDLPTLV